MGSNGKSPVDGCCDDAFDFIKGHFGQLTAVIGDGVKVNIFYALHLIPIQQKFLLIMSVKLKFSILIVFICFFVFQIQLVNDTICGSIAKIFGSDVVNELILGEIFPFLLISP